jgi:hypothetical protein
MIKRRNNSSVGWRWRSVCEKRKTIQDDKRGKQHEERTFVPSRTFAYITFVGTYLWVRIFAPLMMEVFVLDQTLYHKIVAVTLER